MALPRSFNIGRPRDAPPSARPFPDTGKWNKLLLCPACKNKGLQMWYAPYDPVYSTKCLKCSHPYQITPKGMKASEAQAKLGGKHHNPLIQQRLTSNGQHYIDATRLIDDRLEYHQDPRRYIQSGAQPTIDLL